jgi:hypothetical protein
MQNEEGLVMPAVSDANIRAAFERSNIPSSDWDRQGRVLDGALLKVNLPQSAVLAISQTEMSLKPDGSSMGTAPMLLIVFVSGLALAGEKGLFNKRIDVQTISYKKTSAIVPEEKMYDPRRGEMAIQGMVGGSVPRFRIGWNWSQGGPTDAAEAAAERDRILNTIQRAVQGEHSLRGGGGLDSDTPTGRPIRHESKPLLPADIVPRMAEYGQAKWNGQYEISEPGPFDKTLQDMPPEAQRAWVAALSEAVVTAGGWAAMGAQATVMKKASDLADLLAYRAIMDAALEFQRSAGVWEFQLSINEKVYWQEQHQNEPWLARRDPPSRAAAAITPLPVGQERKVAVMSNMPDSNEVYVSHPEADRYVAIVEAPLERDSGRGRVRREADIAGNLYDLYGKLGEAMKLPNYWVDPELEPFFPYPSPKI